MKAITIVFLCFVLLSCNNLAFQGRVSDGDSKESDAGGDHADSKRPGQDSEGLPGYLTSPSWIDVKMGDSGKTRISAPKGTVIADGSHSVDKVVITVLDVEKKELEKIRSDLETVKIVGAQRTTIHPGPDGKFEYAIETRPSGIVVFTVEMEITADGQFPVRRSNVNRYRSVYFDPDGENKVRPLVIEPVIKTVLGLYDKTTKKITIRIPADPLPIEKTINLGGDAGVPVIADWDQSGKIQFGIYRNPQGSYTFYSDKGELIKVMGYGKLNVNSIPLAGDWDGDGKTSIGTYLFDGANGPVFFIQNRNVTGFSDTDVFCDVKNPNWVGIAGDWVGAGRTSVGVYDPTTGDVMLRKPTDLDQPAHFAITFNEKTYAGLSVVAGDWDGDGRDSIGFYDAKQGIFFLRETNDTTSNFIPIHFSIPSADVVPVAKNR